MSWDHKGITIDITRDGRFFFEQPGEGRATCHTNSLKEAQEEVDKYLKAEKPKDLNLKGWVVKETTTHIPGKPSKREYRAVQVDILGVSGTTGEVRLRPPLNSDNIEVGIFPHIDGMQQRLEAYVMVKTEMDAIIASLIQYQIPQRYGYGRIQAANMQARLDELAADYGAARIGKSTGRQRG